MNKFWLAFFVVVFFASQGFCQDAQQSITQVAQIYTGSDPSSSGLIGGFSMWGLMGGILFGSIGFGVFIYGKRILN